MSDPICVVGPARSGSTMLVRILLACGMYIGEREKRWDMDLDVNWDNHESRAFAAMNESILAFLQSKKWFTGGFKTGLWLKMSWWDHQDMIYLLGLGTRLVRSYDKGTWGWKDWRNGLTYPLWRRLMPNLRTVIILRNPLDVESSAHYKAEPNWTTDYPAVWYELSRIADFYVPKPSRIVTHYRNYFANPVREVARVAKFLGLKTDPATVSRAASIVQPDRQRVRFPDSLDGVRPEVVELYQRLSEEGEWRV